MKTEHAVPPGHVEIPRADWIRHIAWNSPLRARPLFTHAVSLTILAIVVTGLARDPQPRNLAPTATITACCHYSGDYLPRFVADGRVSDAGSRSDLREAWCVDGEEERETGWLALEWEQPVTVASIVYHGRTAWMLTECWKDYEVRVDDATERAARGQFEMRHGPQVIAIPPTTLRRLTLGFLSSYGGINPGASEIEIYSESIDEKALRRLTHPLHSVELERKLRSGGLGFCGLIVVQRHALDPTHVYTYHTEGYRAGGGLYRLRLEEDGEELAELVASPDGQILDCDLSHDGTELIFSWRRGEDETYHVYRMGVDGRNLRALTSGPSHNFNACWLPDGGIAFLSTRRPAFAYCWTSPVGILHRMGPDGSDLRRLSANYLNDFTPAVTHDGLIIYGRWEYVDRPAIPIQSLWTLRPDGTGLSVFFGNRVLSPATFIEPQPIPGTGKILCIMTAHNGPCRGAVGILDPSCGVNSQEAIRNLTPEVDIGRVDRGDGNRVRGPYESPYPVDDELYLVSRNGTLLLRDHEGTREVEILRSRDGLGFYTPRPVRPRPPPPVLASELPVAVSVDDAGGSGAWATVYLQDVYAGLEPHVKRGEVKEIRVVQEIEKSELADVRHRAFGFQFPVVSCGATYAPKKVWGHVAVAADGSAAFRVPAGLPVYFMALDASGRAIQRMRSFTHFMPGEVQSCVGCHADRNELAPRSGQFIALAGPPQELRSPEWGSGGFSYARIVQPVLDRHCLPCHEGPEPAGGVDLGGDRTDFFNVSYETLAREGPRPGANPFTSWIPTYNGQEANILSVAPGAWGSPASALAALIQNGHPDGDGKARVELSDAERRRIFAWIDLNVPYYGTSRTNHLEREGCRRMLPERLETVLQEVAARRCASCHGTDGKGRVKIPRRVWTRIERPEWNSFLLAPLARSAGGTEACRQPVFASKDDPDYRAILATFEPIAELLERTPRMDMPAAGEGLPEVGCGMR